MSTACKSNQQTGDLNVSYSNAESEALLGEHNTLAVVEFNEHCSDGGNPQTFSSGTPLLGTGFKREVWRSDSPVTTGILNGCQWACSDSHLFTGIHIRPEQNAANPRQAAFEAYRQILQCMASLGFTHLYKIWNYLPQINLGAGDDEHYKQFCEGRHEAFSEAGYQQPMFPSACALGNQGDTSIVYLLAGKQAGQHFENPLQTAAYHYPREYGPRSPSFARATMAPFGPATQKLILSGTASVLGHKTHHANHFGEQLKATLDNIDTLLEHVKKQARLAHKPEIELLKVYLRNPGDLAQARTNLAAHYGEGTPAVFLHADICRADLLVEIEGICQVYTAP